MVFKASEVAEISRVGVNRGAAGRPSPVPLQCHGVRRTGGAQKEAEK